MGGSNHLARPTLAARHGFNDQNKIGQPTDGASALREQLLEPGMDTRSSTKASLLAQISAEDSRLNGAARFLQGSAPKCKEQGKQRNSSTLPSASTAFHIMASEAHAPWLRLSTKDTAARDCNVSRSLHSTTMELRTFALSAEVWECADSADACTTS